MRIAHEALRSPYVRLSLGHAQQYAIQLQLLGGVWIVQTFPAVIFGLYTRWLEPKALLVGWAVGIGLGTWMAIVLEFKGSIYPLTLFGFTMPGYAAFYSVIANIVVSVVLTALIRLAGAANDRDDTVPADYR